MTNGNPVRTVRYAAEVATSGEGPKVVIDRAALAALIRIAKAAKTYTRSLALMKRMGPQAVRARPRRSILTGEA